MLPCITLHNGLLKVASRSNNSARIWLWEKNPHTIINSNFKSFWCVALLKIKGTLSSSVANFGHMKVCQSKHQKREFYGKFWQKQGFRTICGKWSPRVVALCELKACPRVGLLFKQCLLWRALSSVQCWCGFDE